MTKHSPKTDPETRRVIDKAATARPIDGEVALIGGQHIAGSLTPDAADQTAANLREAAAVARTQKPSTPD